MYAARKLYVKNWSDDPAEKHYSVQITYGGKPVPGYQPERITSVEEEVMYWRKANHIHEWFVQNVQNDEDDCGKYCVAWEQLRDLLDVCNEVIEASKLVDGTVYAGTVYDKDHPGGVEQREPGKVIENSTLAAELLPTTSGFFFGSKEYDEDYLAEVIETRDWIVSMLDDQKNGVPGDIYYSSSW